MYVLSCLTWLIPFCFPDFQTAKHRKVIETSWNKMSPVVRLFGSFWDRIGWNGWTLEVVKKLQELLHDLFFVIVFFFLIVLQGIVITVTIIIDLVLQTIFCMTSLPNSITSNIINRGRRQQSRRRQRCSRRQRQRQLRGSEVPRAGLGEEDFFC